jgi:hypothetical protein
MGSNNKMSKEFHLHITTNEKYKQAFLFSIDRNENNRSIQILDIHVITESNGVESKTSLDMTKLTHLMGQHVNGNILPEGFDELRHVFYDMFSQADKNHLDELILIRDINELGMAEQLIVAGEIALSAHPVNQSIEEIVNDKLNGNKS